MGKARRKFNVNQYDFYVKEFIRKSEENGSPISYNRLRLPQYDLPDSRWYILNCPDSQVDTWAKFVSWCGFYTHGAPLTKERATELIYKMQENIKRPLKYDDFRGRGCYRVPIEYIRNTWGSINKMKQDPGLKIIQESMMDKQLSKEDFDKMIVDICGFVHGENRNFITTREIDYNSSWSNTSTLRRMSEKYYNSKLQDILGKYNVSL